MYFYIKNPLNNTITLYIVSVTGPVCACVCACVSLTCKALFRKQLFCPGSLLRPLLGAIEVMVLGVTSPCTPPTAPPPDAK